MASRKKLKVYRFTPELGEAICDAIAASDYGIRQICEERREFPSPVTIYRWLSSGEGERFDTFRKQYAGARETQAERLAADVIRIADDGKRDYVLGQDGVLVDYDHIQRARLRVDARKWAAAHLAPKRWGDKTQHEVSGAIQVQTFADLAKSARE